ncbi:MAG: WD40/YVTN/BNR-like repeat-containing protein, partial [Candidatus Aminicenantales bacterium]
MRQSVLAVAASVLVLAAFAFAQPKPVRPKILQSTAPELRLKGFEEYKAMQAASKFKDLKWQFIGPTNISGRVTDVAVVAPKGSNYTVYVASASGGVWKTENEGTTWTPIFENMATAAIGDIALAPSDQNIVWVGTGEHNIFRSSQAGAGIFKSADGGKTWANMGLADTNTIARIVVHPTNPDVVYVAAGGHEWTKNTDRGVYKTVDGGKTWDKVLFVNDETGAYDLVMDPRSSDTLYAALWQRTRKKWNDPRTLADHTGSGLFKTTDGGKTWTPIDAGLPQAQFRGRIGIDLCLTRPDVLYALVDNYELRETTKEELDQTRNYYTPEKGFIKGATVFRSDDGGATWTQTSGLTPQQKNFMQQHSGTYGWVFGQIRVDPNDPETSYIMGVPFSVSTDGGKTYKTLRTSPGGDNHALWIDPANSSYLIKGFDQGVAASYDKGLNWRYFQKEINVCQFFNLNYDMATPFRVYGSMQDHGSFRGKVDISRGRDRIPAQDFESAPGGEGSNHAIDPSNPDIVYSAGFYGTISRAEYDKPGPFPGYPYTKELLPVLYENEAPLRGQWLAPFILSPHSPNILYHGMQYVFRSLDRGDTWERISPDLTTNDPATRGDIRYQTLFTISESPLKYGLVYAGTDDGRLWVTKDGGKAWQEITAGLAPGKWMSRVVASAYQLGTVYLSQNGKRDDDFTPYVWKSTDYGKTWTSLAKGIPVGPVNVLREDPVDEKILYLGTDLGVYVTTDSGKTWMVL